MPPKYLWSQDRDEVVVSVVAPAGVRARDVTVRCTATDIFVAVDGGGGVATAAAEESNAEDENASRETTRREEKTSSSSTATTRVLLSDAWAHPIDPEPRDEDEDEERRGGGLNEEDDRFGDWEVCDYEPLELGGRRVVRVTVRKRGLGALTHWWKKATADCDEIDPGAIRDRKPGRASEAARVWEEATEAFKRRVREREPIVVPDDRDPEGEAEAEAEAEKKTGTGTEPAKEGGRGGGEGGDDDARRVACFERF